MSGGGGGLEAPEGPRSTFQESSRSPTWLDTWMRQIRDITGHMKSKGVIDPSRVGVISKASGLRQAASGMCGWPDAQLAQVAQSEAVPVRDSIVHVPHHL